MNRVIERFASTYTYQRRNPQVWVKGRTSPATLQAAVSFRASIQPMNGRELLVLPEGERTREYIKLYTDTQLNMADPVTGAKGDLVSYKGRTWEVTQSNDWNLNDYAHFKFLAVVVEADKS
jgi:hypothetical protein